MRYEPSLFARLDDARRRADDLRDRQLARFDEAVRWAAADPRGRLLLWELMARSNWLASRLAAPAAADGSRLASDPCLTAWNDGRAEAGQFLFGTLGRLCPERFLQMQGEASRRAAADAQDLEGEGLHDRYDRRHRS